MLVRQDEQHPTVDQMYEFLKTNLPIKIIVPMASKLTWLGRKILEIPNEEFFGVYFDTIINNGEAYRDYIKITDRYTDDISKKLIDQLFQSLFDNDAYDSEIV